MLQGDKILLQIYVASEVSGILSSIFFHWTIQIPSGIKPEDRTLNALGPYPSSFDFSDINSAQT